MKVPVAVQPCGQNLTYRAGSLQCEELITPFSHCAVSRPNRITFTPGAVENNKLFLNSWICWALALPVDTHALPRTVLVKRSP
jgi:hypothetical protein